MIIKVQHKDPNSWWIFDGVQKVRYQTGLRISRDELMKDNEEGHGYDITIIATKVLPDGKHIDTEDPLRYALLIFRDINNNEKSLMFNTVAYLCNEQGQTVEKIVP